MLYLAHRVSHLLSVSALLGTQFHVQVQPCKTSTNHSRSLIDPECLFLPPLAKDFLGSQLFLRGVFPYGVYYYVLPTRFIAIGT